MMGEPRFYEQLKMNVEWTTSQNLYGGKGSHSWDALW